MYKIHVVKASNLPSADRNGLSDPFVVIYAKTSDGKIKIGQTKVVKKNLNPDWDSSLQKPFFVYTPLVKELKFKVYDKDVIGKDKLGSLKFESQFATPLNSFPIKSKRAFNNGLQFNDSNWPTLTVSVQLISDRSAFEDRKKGELNKYQRVGYMLEFNPPLPAGKRNTNLSFLAFDRVDGGMARRLPRQCNFDDRGVKVKYPTTDFQSGWSPVATLNLPKLETHLFSNVQFYYIPVIEVEDYSGVITLLCFGISKDCAHKACLLYDEPIELHVGPGQKEIVNSLTSFHLHDCYNTLEHSDFTKTIGETRIYLSSLENFYAFANCVKKVVLPPETKIFNRLELDVDKAITLRYASQFHQRPLPEKLIFYADWNSTSGHTLDEGIQVFDKDFNPLGMICSKHEKAFDKSLEWKIDRTQKYDQFKNETLYLRVNLSGLPKEARFVALALAGYSNSEWPMKYGGFFRIIEEDSLFEFVNMTARYKGHCTGVNICVLWKMDNGDWAVLPMLKSFTHSGFTKGLKLHFEKIREYLKTSSYLQEMTAVMNQYY
ncbi:hypothetical protein TRFO_31189 [Tritrichomonas foetus]|uniref:C2 domain-containing protein n=1 Tax=Tritrichomonas foetus TaxID=1144522 RepID=A0A1J4JT33_9EUKA|nr:hypothetical protein TRFO_31189 [Tritrichomonas foetus]|eukprot:OHT01898.1 hypothetical protein TRFO_31189 [Tritrichomonas foetus]